MTMEQMPPTSHEQEINQYSQGYSFIYPRCGQSNNIYLATVKEGMSQLQPLNLRDIFNFLKKRDSEHN